VRPQPSEVTEEVLAERRREPGDDTYDKLPFYASLGVAEVLIVHRDRQVQLFRLDGRGEMAEMTPA